MHHFLESVTTHARVIFDSSLAKQYPGEIEHSNHVAVFPEFQNLRRVDHVIVVAVENGEEHIQIEFELENTFYFFGVSRSRILKNSLFSFCDLLLDWFDEIATRLIATSRAQKRIAYILRVAMITIQIQLPETCLSTLGIIRQIAVKETLE